MTDRPGDDVVARSGVWTIGAVTAAAVADYVIYGPNPFVVQVWLWSLVLLVLRTWFLDPRPPRLPRGDIRALLGIAVVALPIYLLGVADVPLQVQSDEVSVTLAMRRFATGPAVDPFGVSDYLGHAYGALLVYGELAQHLASVDLVTVRSINGVVSVGALLAIYLLARQLLPRRWALVAVTVVGVNHAFFSFGRMAVRETSITLVAALALALLLRALRHGHPGAAVLGGVVLGLGWYTYFPSRVLVLLWFAFLAGLWLVRQRDVDVRRLRSVAAWSGVAFALTAAPLVVALVKGSNDPGTNVMTRNAVFIFADAREIQRDWVGADSVAGGWWRNVRDGVTAFGNDVPDRSLHYSNPGHGFVDPVTAALLWIGVMVTAVQLWRRAELWSWLPFGCFVAFWLAFAMLVNKAPSYARLLIVLPFVGYLAAVGLRALVPVRVPGPPSTRWRDRPGLPRRRSRPERLIYRRPPRPGPAAG